MEVSLLMRGIASLTIIITEESVTNSVLRTSIQWNMSLLTFAVMCIIRIYVTADKGKLMWIFPWGKEAQSLENTYILYSCICRQHLGNHQ